MFALYAQQTQIAWQDLVILVIFFVLPPVFLAYLCIQMWRHNSSQGHVSLTPRREVPTVDALAARLKQALSPEAVSALSPSLPTPNQLEAAKALARADQARATDELTALLDRLKLANDQRGRASAILAARLLAEIDPARLETRHRMVIAADDLEIAVRGRKWDNVCRCGEAIAQIDRARAAVVLTALFKKLEDEEGKATVARLLVQINPDRVDRAQRAAIEAGDLIVAVRNGQWAEVRRRGAVTRKALLDQLRRHVFWPQTNDAYFNGLLDVVAEIAPEETADHLLKLAEGPVTSDESFDARKNIRDALLRLLQRAARAMPVPILDGIKRLKNVSREFEGYSAQFETAWSSTHEIDFAALVQLADQELVRRAESGRKSE